MYPTSKGTIATSTLVTCNFKLKLKLKLKLMLASHHNVHNNIDYEHEGKKWTLEVRQIEVFGIATREISAPGVRALQFFDFEENRDRTA